MENQGWMKAIANTAIHAMQQSINRGFIGSEHFHIETIKMIGMDSEGCWAFEVCLWNEISDEPNSKKVVSLVELCDLVAGAVSEAICREILSQDWQEQHPGMLP